MFDSTLTRRAAGALAAAGVAAMAGNAEPAAAKCRKKKVVQPDIIHVAYDQVCLEPVAGQGGRGYFAPFMLELMTGAGGGVWYDADNVPTEIGNSGLVPETGPITYQISGVMAPESGEAGAAGSLERVAFSFEATSGEIDGIIKLYGDVIAGPRPTVMLEVMNASVVAIPQKKG